VRAAVEAEGALSRSLCRSLETKNGHRAGFFPPVFFNGPMNEKVAMSTLPISHPWDLSPEQAADLQKKLF
jgi:hypothetical protein